MDSVQVILMAHDTLRIDHASHPSACISPHLELEAAACRPGAGFKRAPLPLATEDNYLASVRGDF